MISITQIAASVVAVGTIGGGALTLDNLHVAAEDFKEYIEQQQQADEAEYVLALKQDIRELRQLLMLHPDDEYIANELQSMVDELCEFRPDDRLCEG
jgi:hypothetical protein